MKTEKYKVLVDFPGSIWKVGHIIEADKFTGRVELIEVNREIGYDDVRNFPHIYRKCA